MRRFRAAMGLALLSASCAATLQSGRPSRIEAPPSTSFGRLPKPARWLPLDNEAPRFSDERADGSLLLVERGLRLVQHLDGAIEAAPDLLPSDGQLGALELPSRLGGGFLFYVSGGDATSLFKAHGFTDRLTPLVRLPFEASDVVAGFDRLYALSGRTRALVGIDVTSGKLIDRGPIPDASAYGGVAFSEGWLGAVETDLRGILVTFDAGASWHGLGMAPAVPGSLHDRAVVGQNGHVVVETTRGAFTLEPSGELVRVDTASTETAFLDGDEDDSTDDVSDVRRANPFGARPIEVATLRGYPDSAGTALVLSNGALARVSLADGRVVQVSEHAVPHGATCQAVELGGGIGFVCGEAAGPTSVYAFRAPFGVVPVLSFDSPRYVASSGNGALVVRGSCMRSNDAPPGTYCVVSRAETHREVHVVGAVGAVRVVALADGRAAIVVPPRPHTLGTLTVVELNGKSTSVPLSLESVSDDARGILERGIWLDGMVEAEPDVLYGWAATDPFVGFRISLDGKLKAGSVQPSVERASFSGKLGFFTDGRSSARESLDGGMTWSDVGVPAENLGDPAPDHERGCTPVGCSVGPWLRIGWGKDRARADLLTAAEPPKAVVEPPSFVTWSFSCAPTGETEGASDVLSTTRRERPRSAERSSSAPDVPGAFASLETSAWRPFLGSPSPERGPDDLGFDFGTEDQVVQLRGYAWGTRGASWDQAGSWLIRAVDRFRVRRAIWSTAPSRSPWVDAGAAAEVFGSDPTHRVSNEWNGILDPVDEAGIVVMHTGTTTALAVLEQGRAITTIDNADEFTIDRPSGAVKVDGKFFLGVTPGPRSFQVLGVDRGTLSVAGSFPRLSDDAFARVVRTERGDALGIWVVARGRQGSRSGGDTWFVYPMDTQTGELSAPLVVEHGGLSHAPSPCGPESDGWVLGYDVSPSITKLDFTNVAETPSIEHLEARLVAGPSGVCLDALAAQVEGDPPKDLKPRGIVGGRSRTVSFALTDRATDRRWGFRCAP